MVAMVHLNSPTSHPKMNPSTLQIGGWIILRISKHFFEEDKNLSPILGFEPSTFQPLVLTVLWCCVLLPESPLIAKLDPRDMRRWNLLVVTYNVGDWY